MHDDTVRITHGDGTVEEFPCEDFDVRAESDTIVTSVRGETLHTMTTDEAEELLRQLDSVVAVAKTKDAIDWLR